MLTLSKIIRQTPKIITTDPLKAKEQENLLKIQKNLQQDKRITRSLKNTKEYQIERKEFFKQHEAIAKYDFPDSENDYKKRKVTKATSGIVATIKDPRQYLPGIRNREAYKDEVLHVQNPYNYLYAKTILTGFGLERFVPNMFGILQDMRNQKLRQPYDSRKESKDYYIYAVNNLLELSFSCWASFPEPVKESLSDDVFNM